MNGANGLTSANGHNDQNGLNGTNGTNGLNGHGDHMNGTNAHYHHDVSNSSNNHTNQNDTNGANSSHMAVLSQVKAWNGELIPREEHCIHHIISSRATTDPDAPATDAWDGALSYRELDDVTTRLAYQLSQAGVGIEDKVPLCFEKSQWTVVAMVAVLKAGGAFVPLDPEHPIERLRDMMRSVDAKVALASTQNVGLLLGSVDRVVEISEKVCAHLPEAPVAADEEIPISAVQPSNAAYVLYTSGSTGTPKGCVIEHAAYCTSAKAHGAAVGIGPGRRVFQFASYAFDASVFEMLTTLLRGACICIPSDHEKMNDLASSMARYRADWSTLTATTAKMLHPDTVPTLRTLCLGGELSPESLIRLWADRVELFNGYGPTESAVFASANRWHRDSNPRTLGKGTGTRLWVVNWDEARHCEFGETGELLIETPALARGYLNDPAKTAAAFIDAPEWLGLHPGARLYRAGDLALYRANGDLEYVGRRDHQIKIRGHRIELGEIEHAIEKADAAVDSVLVVAHQQRLIAVLSFKSDDKESDDDDDGAPLSLRMETGDSGWATRLTAVVEATGSRLPTTMVPTSWLVVNRLPATLSAKKLDRLTTQKWVSSLDEDTLRLWRTSSSNNNGNDDDASQAGGENGEANDNNMTEAERLLRRLCGETLNVDPAKINMRQSFLAQGGDSITAMQLVSTSKTQGLLITVKNTLLSKTLGELAKMAKLDAAAAAAAAAAVATTCVNGAVTQEEDETPYYEPFPLSPIQQFFFDLTPEGEHHFNQSFLVELTKPVTADQVRAAADAVVRRHAMLRARFVRDDKSSTTTRDGTGASAWSQRIVPPSDSASCYLLDCPATPDATIAEADLLPAVAALQSRLHLERGPLAGFGLWKVAGETGGKQMLFATCHHAVVDLVSWRVLLQELEEHVCHGAFGPSAPAPAVSFPRWLDIQRQHTAKRIEPSAALPHATGAYRPEFWGLDKDSGLGNTVQDVEAASFVLDEAATEALFGAGARERWRVEPIDLLVAGLAASFHEVFPERETPFILNEGHGREVWEDVVEDDQEEDGQQAVVDLSRTVGWFTTLTPLWAPVSGQSLVEAIADIKDQRRLAPAKGLSYFSARYLHPQGRDMYGAHRDSEIFFNYEGAYQQLEREGGLFRHSALSTPHQLSDNRPESRRVTIFEWSSMIKNGRLHVAVDFHRGMRHRDRVLRWVGAYQRLLEGLPAVLASHARPLVTRGDFVPLVRLGRHDWDEVLRQLGKNKGAVDKLEEMYAPISAQEGMLIGQSLNSELYMADIYATIKPRRGDDGVVDVDRLRAAWRLVERRHSALRTTFSSTIGGSDSAFTQLVFSERPDRLGVPGASEPGADFSAEPSTAHPGAADVHLRVNHVAVDASSLAIILRDLSMAYDGKITEQDDEAARFSVYSAWRRARPASLVSVHKQYWLDYTRGMTPSLFPLEEKAEAVTGGKMDLRAPPQRAMQRFCAETEATIAHVLHAALAVVLRAFLGQDDVCFSYFASDQDLGEHGCADSAGVYIDALLCRANMGDDVVADGGQGQQERIRTVGDLVRHMRGDAAEGLAHQYGCNTAEIQHALGAKRVANVGISVQRDWPSCWTGRDTRMDDLSWSETNDFGIGINAIDAPDGVVISVGWPEGRVAPEVVRGFGAAFETALESIVCGGGSGGSVDSRPLSDVRLVGPDAMARIERWSPTAEARGNYPTEACVHDTVRRQASGPNRDGLAIASWDGDMTYGELDEASDAVARHLVGEHGLKIGEKVPCCFAKSRWVLVGLFGVLKAGGVVVPMEHSNPVARLGMLAKTVRARVALASPQFVGKLAEAGVETVVALGETELAALLKANSGKGEEEEVILLPEVTPEDQATIMFTSGSSGTPKGCINLHKTWCSSAAGQLDGLHMRHRRRFLQFASYSFGASLTEMLTGLQVGGTVCFISDHAKFNDVEAAIAESRADWALLPPSLVRAVDSLGSIATLVCGGESLDRGSVARWSGRLDLLQAYGATETAVITTAKPMGAATDPKTLGATIHGAGRVVSPSDYRQLLPPGCMGELLVEGPHLGGGYLDNPAKTAEVFVGDAPWMGTNGDTRYYRTGDMARVDPVSGDIIYMGRQDGQVKINGMRVELGEVEAALRANVPGSEAGVAAEVMAPVQGPNATGSTMLFAFVVLGAAGFDGDEPGYAYGSEEESVAPVDYSPRTWETLAGRISGVDDALARALPRHMIPSCYVPLREMPLTASFKVDRQKLKALGRRLRASGTSLPTPASATDGTLAKRRQQQQERNGLAIRQASSGSDDEGALSIKQQVVGLWEGLFPGRAISINDNFFQLGGDSLMAMKLVTQARQKRIQITTADVLKNPVLSDLILALGGSLQDPVNNGSSDQKKTADLASEISSLWKALFPGRDIAMADNFFQLGGDSLMAMKLVTQARGKRIQMTTADVLKNPVLSDLIAALGGSLPAAAAEDDENSSSSTAASLTNEILNLWKGLFPGREINMHDNFFQLGGDSLMAMKLVTQARSRRIQITAADVLKKPVLSDLVTSLGGDVSAAASAVASAGSKSSSGGRGKNTTSSGIQPLSLLDDDDKAAADEVVSHVAAQCNVDRSAIRDVFPCTPLQEAMFASSAQHLGVNMGHLVMEVTGPNRGQLDEPRFRRAVAELARRHPILRTRIVHSPGMHILQAVLDDGAASAQLPVERVDSMADYIARARSTPITFGDALSRFAVEVSEDEKVTIIWSLHHALYDGWAFHMMKRDLSLLYDGDCGSSTALTLQPRVPFVNYIAYQRSVSAESTRSFWQEYMRGAEFVPFPSIPAHLGRGYAPQPTSYIEGVVESLPATPPPGATLQTAIRAAFGLASAAYTGLPDAVFTTVVTGRDADLPGIEDVVGPTLSTVPVRVTRRLQGKSNQERDEKREGAADKRTVPDLLRGLQDAAAAMIPHQHIGMHGIARVGGDAARRACENTTLLVVHPEERSSSDDEEEDTFRYLKDPTEAASVFSTYTVIFQCYMRTGPGGEKGFAWSCWHDPAALEVGKARRFAGLFEHTLQTILGGGGGEAAATRVADLPLIGSGDRDLIEEMQPRLPVPAEEGVQLVHDMVAEQARRVGTDAEAVAAWDGNLSYGELEGLAGRLARKLRSLGVGPEKKVIVCLDKSKWQAVALLGVLKAGGAFVPVDPSYPKANLRKIVMSVDPEAVVASPRLAKLFPRLLEFVDATDPESWVDDDNDDDGYDGDSDEDEASEEEEGGYSEDEDDNDEIDGKRRQVSPSNAAFILFTSGSTGTPKGCIIDHSAYCFSARRQAQGVNVSRSSRVFSFASLSFDAAMLDVLTTLMLGKTVCVPSERERVDDLPGAITRLAADSVMLTPSVLSALDPSSVPTLRTIISGGEPLDPDTIRCWKTHRPDLTLINGYGPAEGSVVCVANHAPHPAGPRNVGRAFGARCWVADPNDPETLVPVGAVGELLLEGPGLARGYLNDEARTAAAFLPPARGYGEGGGRRYRTGDLVYQESDGSLVYVGRGDSQVKVRGQRCETAEIERRVLQVEGIAQAVVVLSEGERGQHQLVAVVAMEGDDTPVASVSLAEEDETDGKKKKPKKSKKKDDSAAASAAASELLDMVPPGSDSATRARKLADEACKHVARNLPGFMVPTTVLAVRRVPLSVSGKTDKKKVSEWVASLVPGNQLLAANLVGGGADDDGNAVVREPANMLETKLRDMWAAVLRVPAPQLTTDRSFVQLGGDSISAMQVMSKCRGESDNGLAQLGVQDILHTSSIRELAAKVAAATAADQQTLLMPPMINGGDDITAATSAATTTANSTAGTATPATTAVSSDDGKEPTATAIDSIISRAAAYASIKPSAIEAVEPATDTQRSMAAAAMTAPRTQVAFLHFEFPQGVDHDRLRVACRRLVAAHSALRSFFFDDEDKSGECYQVALHPSETQSVFSWTAKPDSADVAAAAKSWVDSCHERLPAPGEPLIRFCLTSSSGSSAATIARLDVEICHALYDGIGYAQLVRDLERTYAEAGGVDSTKSSDEQVGELLTSSGPQMHEYLARLRAASDEGASRAHWRRLLAGTATMTHVAPWTATAATFEKQQPAVIDKLLTKTVAMPSSSHEYPTATVVKAAWAGTLARAYGLRDVVFGQVVSGRNGGVDGMADLDKVVGACINTAPVRAVFDDGSVGSGGSSTTWASLLDTLQRQHNEGTPHETTGIRQLVADGCFSTDSTPHPLRPSRYSTVVNHLGHQDPTHGRGALVLADGHPCATGLTAARNRSVDLGLESRVLPAAAPTTGDDDSAAAAPVLELNLLFSTATVPSAWAADLLDLCARHVGECLRAPEGRVTSSHDHSLLGRLSMRAVHPLVRAAWVAALEGGGGDDEKRNKVVEWDGNRPFWEVIPLPASSGGGGGDGDDDDGGHQQRLELAQCIADFLLLSSAEGTGAGVVSVTAAELVERPTMALQSELVMRKLGRMD